MTSDYCVAVHALVYLNHKAKVLSSEELAENICTNPARVRKVIGKAEKGRFCKTKEEVKVVIFLTRTRTRSRWTRLRRRWKSGLWTRPGRAATRI